MAASKPGNLNPEGPKAGIGFGQSPVSSTAAANKTAGAGQVANNLYYKVGQKYVSPEEHFANFEKIQHTTNIGIGKIPRMAYTPLPGMKKPR